MQSSISRFLDKLSNYLAHRKGLLPTLGILLIFFDLVVQFIPGMELVAEKNLLLHLGLITAILGLMLAWAL